MKGRMVGVRERLAGGLAGLPACARELVSLLALLATVVVGLVAAWNDRLLPALLGLLVTVVQVLIHLDRYYGVSLRRPRRRKPLRIPRRSC